jgi:hypothetical protein
MLCQYSKILGEKGKGFHEARLFGLARNDTLGTIGLAGITTYTTNTPFWKSLVGWFVAGEVLHYAFCVNTAFLSALGVHFPPHPQPDLPEPL